MSFPGLPGVVTALGLLVVIWLTVYLMTKGQPVVFDPGGKPGEFGKRLLPMYLDIAKFVMGLGSASIVLLVGSSNYFNQSNTRPSLQSFASPLFVVAMSIVFGVLFMILLVLNYERHLHRPNSYTRFEYTRNQSLGFSALACFCVGYTWLVVAATS
jgi:hypothetical protein